MKDDIGAIKRKNAKPVKAAGPNCDRVKNMHSRQIELFVTCARRIIRQTTTWIGAVHAEFSRLESCWISAISSVPAC